MQAGTVSRLRFCGEILRIQNLTLSWSLWDWSSWLDYFSSSTVAIIYFTWHRSTRAEQHSFGWRRQAQGDVVLWDQSVRSNFCSSYLRTANRRVMVEREVCTGTWRTAHILSTLVFQGRIVKIIPSRHLCLPFLIAPENTSTTWTSCDQHCSHSFAC